MTLVVPYEWEGNMRLWESYILPATKHMTFDSLPFQYKTLETELIIKPHIPWKSVDGFVCCPRRFFRMVIVC